jgi:hypothetical protein
MVAPVYCLTNHIKPPHFPTPFWIFAVRLALLMKPSPFAPLMAAHRGAQPSAQK